MEKSAKQDADEGDAFPSSFYEPRQQCASVSKRDKVVLDD